VVKTVDKGYVAVALVAVSILVSVAMLMGYDSAIYGIAIAVISALAAGLGVKKEVKSLQSEIKSWIPVLKLIEDTLIEEEAKAQIKKVREALELAAKFKVE